MSVKNYSDKTRNETSDQFNVSQLYLLSWFVNDGRKQNKQNKTFLIKFIV